MKQTLALTFVNLRGTLQRPGTALVLIFAVAVSVAVLVCVLGLRQGLGAIVDNVGRSDRVLILGENAPSETASNLTRETLGLLQGAPGVALDAAGAPLMIAEAVIAVPVIDRSGAFADVALRGTSAQVLAVRPEARIVRGRLFQSGLREVVVGKLASEQYRDMDVGATLWLRNEPWTVVGIFSTLEGPQESEIWTDFDTALNVFHKEAAQSATAILASPQGMSELESFIKAHPQAHLAVWTETAYLLKQTERLNGLLRWLANGAGGLICAGALLAVLNTLYTVVGYRRRETATLRALGFADLWVLGGALGEAIILCVGSAAIGAAFAWALYHDHAWSSLLAGNSRMVFRMHIGAQELALAFAVAVTISLIGGLLGALRTLRAPAAQGLR